jgi:hypothetical protein
LTPSGPRSSTFEFDGLFNQVFLIDSFDLAADSVAGVDATARDLLAAQTAPVDANGIWWSEEPIDTEYSLWHPKTSERTQLQVLHQKFHQLVGQTRDDTRYQTICALGPFEDFVICDALFEAIDSKSELISYFADIGESLRKGMPRRLPV